MNFNKNINKKFDFGTVQYEFYESSRESLYFYSMFRSSIYRFYKFKIYNFLTKIEKKFLEKNLKLFLSFFEKNLKNSKFFIFRIINI
jgi:hypothetical protein